MKKVNLSIIDQLFIPRILIVVLPTAILGLFLSANISLLTLMSAVIAIITLDFAANVLNNYADWEIDETNEKRLEMHQAYTKQDLLILTVILIVPSLVLSIFNGLLFLFSCIAFLFLSASYSLGIKTKDKFPFNYMTIALAYGPLSLLIGFFSGSSSPSLLLNWFWVLLLIFFVDFFFSPTKDYEDELGDRKYNKNTLVTLFGRRKAKWIQFLGIFATFALMTLYLLYYALPNFLLIVPLGILSLVILTRIGPNTSKRSFSKIHDSIRLIALSLRLLIAVLAII